MFRFLLPKDFWEGLSKKKQRLGQSLLLFAGAFPIASILALFLGLYWIAVGMFLLSILCGGAFFAIFKKRLRAWRNDEGWRCYECQERIGYDDIEEAFLTKGKLGKLPTEFTAGIECSNGHYSNISWNDAVKVMFAKLEEYISESQTQSILNEKKEDSLSQEKYKIAKSFFTKGTNLLNGEVEDYLYQDLSTLHRNLSNYANRKWTPQNKDILYDLLANIVAYRQVSKLPEQEDLSVELNGNSSIQFANLGQTQIYVDEIENFKLIENVSTYDVDRFLSQKGYFNKSEEFIQLALESILNEKLHKKDWGGESNDLYTSNVIVKGKRRNAAFILKGHGTKTKLLKPKDIGQNGDQIIKAFATPAEIFFLQFVGNIDESVVKTLDLGVQGLRHQGKPAFFCIINGQDTARLLYAYNKI
jgi:hypothetical protein